VQIPFRISFDATKNRAFGLCVGCSEKWKLKDEQVVFSTNRSRNFLGRTNPRIAATANIQGVVVVRVKLDDKGQAIDAVAISGAGLLILDSLTNARKWSFEPNPQKTAILVYDFRFKGFCPRNTDTNKFSNFVVRPPNFALITGCRPTL
jgi:TonB family protein